MVVRTPPRLLGGVLLLHHFGFDWLQILYLQAGGTPALRNM